MLGGFAHNKLKTTYCISLSRDSDLLTHLRTKS